jgi:metal-responsive CopG/Arc/MetJ family transcriptional regulator
MSTGKIAITIQEHLLDELDRLVKAGVFPNRSKALQEAVDYRENVQSWIKSRAFNCRGGFVRGDD